MQNNTIEAVEVLEELFSVAKEAERKAIAIADAEDDSPRADAAWHEAERASKEFAAAFAAQIA